MTRKRLLGKSGISLLELIIATLIGSIVVSTVFQSQRFITQSAARENDKALMQRDIFTVIEFLERDIRMAGLGLPGNGIEAQLSDTTSDVLRIFINVQQQYSKLTAAASEFDNVLYVENGQVLQQAGWVCVEGTDTVFIEVDRVGVSVSAQDTVFLTEQIGIGSYPVTSKVYPANRIVYRVSNISGSAFVRKQSNNEVNLSKMLDTMNILLKDSSGVPITGAISSARVLTVVFGGTLGSGGNEVFMAESTEVNIRNSL